MLPLLQAVPLHIDATRNALNDTISKLTSPQKLTSDSPKQNVVIGKRKWSQRSLSSSPLAESPCKKRTDLTGNAVNVTPTVQSSGGKPDVTSSVGPFKLSSSSTLKNHSPLQKSSSPLTHPANAHTTSTSSLSRRNTFVLPNLSTPRKPLSNLSVQLSRQTGLNLPNTLIPGNSVPRSNTAMSRPSPQTLLDITPTAAAAARSSRNGFAYKQKIVDQMMPPLNQNLISHENRPIDLVKNRIIPTAVALDNMKEAPVSCFLYLFFIPLLSIDSPTLSDIFFSYNRGMEGDLFRWLIPKMRMKNKVLLMFLCFFCCFFFSYGNFFCGLRVFIVIIHAI